MLRLQKNTRSDLELKETNMNISFCQKTKENVVVNKRKGI